MTQKQTDESELNNSLESEKQENIKSENSLDNKASDKILEIKDKMFIAQCNDIYLNPDDYKGRTVKLEGIYDEYTDTESGKTYHYIIRYGPGCCGNDGVAGFEFFYDGNIPEPNDWIEVLGTIEIVDRDDGYQSVVIHLSKITVLEERGEEFVYN